PAVGGLALGEADLANELGLRGEDSFGWIRSRIVIAAVAAGLPAPAMAVYTDLSDPQGLAESCARGRALGMFGRTALHPRQLPTIAAAFAPDARELRLAREVVDAAAGAEADGSGAIALPDGRFIDAPMVAAAKRTLQLGERLKGAEG
ncbi:MAG: CoA ester lyase, partial [Stackebrandtia sp.]